MKFKTALRISVVMMFVIFLCSPVLAANTKPIKWKLQTLWSAGELPYKCLQDFCKRVKTATNGRLIIEPFPAGAIVPTFETLDAVKNDIIQVMNVWPGYFTGKNPAFAPLTDFICGYEHPWEYEAFFYNQGGMKLLNELYKPYNVTSIGVVLWGVESMSMKYPVLKMSDFKGHKFRSPQGMTADMLKALGAGVVVLPGEETYSALDKGVVDGADWSTPSVNYRMGFNRVAKYYIYPGFRSMPVSDFTINNKEWQKLPDDIKQILKSMVKELNQDQLIACHTDDFKAIREMNATGDVDLVWSKEDIAQLRQLVRNTVWKEWAAKSPMCKKVVDAQIAWLKKIDRIN